MTTAQHKFTVDDYRALPDGPPHTQLIDGEFFVFESATPFHQQILGNLQVALVLWARATGGGTVALGPLDVYLSQFDVVQPDLIFIARDRLSIIQRRIHGPPDLVIEILSPSTRAVDKGKKAALYARSGVKEMWIVEPELEAVMLHHFGKGGEMSVRTATGTDIIASSLLPGFEMKAAEVFESDLPPEARIA